MKATTTVLGLTAPLIAFDLPPGLDLEQPAISVGVPPVSLFELAIRIAMRRKECFYLAATQGLLLEK
ncbi:hypothetical protein GGP41_004803 [Bipolaris sorokiniana]|uniref:Uncharacterized protein n=1 Tax=Cochliobolus sativus TaxID=45130 RepID=A0A8H6DST2_COCSA|nr:hypothetical protein GGP41_004803 [Bipolaris sorokiniana]